MSRVLETGAYALLGCAVACQSPAILRTARTLPAGKNDFSLSLNLTHITARAAGVPSAVAAAASSQFNYPNPIPEILYSHGVSNDVELGGRVGLGSGLFELNSKFRFVHTAGGRFHAALAPALAYRVLGLVNGPVVTLPLLLTYELNPNLALSGGLLGSYASYDVADGLGAKQADLGGDTLYAGGGAGVELRLGGFHVFPAIELQRSVSRTGTAASAPDIGMLFFSITVGIGARPSSGETAPAPAPAAPVPAPAPAVPAPSAPPPSGPPPLAPPAVPGAAPPLSACACAPRGVPKASEELGRSARLGGVPSSTAVNSLENALRISRRASVHPR